ncbi:MAG TPA: GGDEF domain-containing protein, partial [Spirochaetia bacterium]|nr:GGDEF domain-containing protein [Spirochaetia bacterium]
MTIENRLRREAERREAERRAQEDGSESIARERDEPIDAEALVHELRVHQIELELQNEELRRTQEVLEQTKAEFVDLYDEAPVGYASLDASAVITRANRRFALLLGADQSRLVGRP